MDGMINNEIIIDGVICEILTQVKDNRGAVMHHLNFKSTTFKGFEEAYISKSYPGIVKAWKMHLRMSQNFCVPTGRFRFILFDDRESSPTRKTTNEFILDDDLEYKLLFIPLGVWYGFQCISESPGLIVNIANVLFDPHEVVRLELNNKVISFSDWKKF